MLHYLTVPVTPFQQNCSILWCDETREAAVVDPGGDLAKIRAEISDKYEELGGLRARWDIEKQGLDRIGEIKVLIDDLRAIAERAQREGDFEQASRILYAEIPTFEEELARVTAETNARSAMVKEEVTADDIAGWAGTIPYEIVTRLNPNLPRIVI